MTFDPPYDLREMLARLDRIERAQRRWRRIALGFVAAASMTGLIGATTLRQGADRREITTQRLIINGPDNQPRLMMTGEGNGSSLFLYGPDKYRGTGGGGGGAGGGGEGGATPRGGVGGVVSLRPRMRFMVEDAGSKIELLDPDGKTRFLITLDTDGSAVRRLDADGNEIVTD
jgi:hypothetical protein